MPSAVPTTNPLPANAASMPYVRPLRRGHVVGPAFRPRFFQRLFGLRVFSLGGQRFLNYFAGPDAQPAQSVTVRRRGDLRKDLATALEKNLSACALRPDELFEDEEYYLPTRTEVEQVFNARTWIQLRYKARVMDCEDFAYSLRADFALHRFEDSEVQDSGTYELRPFAVGVVWGGFAATRHVWNIVVTDTGILFVDSTPGSAPYLTLKEWDSASKRPKPIDYIAI